MLGSDKTKNIQGAPSHQSGHVDTEPVTPVMEASAVIRKGSREEDDNSEGESDRVTGTQVIRITDGKEKKSSGGNRKSN